MIPMPQLIHTSTAKRIQACVQAGVLACLLSLGAAQSQSTCPAGAGISAEALMGTWRVTLHTQPPEQWTLALHAHPEHLGSLQGTLVRGQQGAQVVADWDEGEFTMEESHDGQRIAATWLGGAAQGQCGNAIEGTRTMGDATQPVRFTLESNRLR